ncbi:hypothetical protein HYQ46_008865 [Verticillium longisporum]|nr:hypothetical protein HYQ46_008865 [Verticillium longisporum]
MTFFPIPTLVHDGGLQLQNRITEYLFAYRDAALQPLIILWAPKEVCYPRAYVGQKPSSGPVDVLSQRCNRAV